MNLQHASGDGSTVRNRDFHMSQGWVKMKPIYDFPRKIIEYEISSY